MFDIYLAFNEDYLTYSPKAFTTARKCLAWMKRQNKEIPGRYHYYMQTLELDSTEIKK